MLASPIPARAHARERELRLEREHQLQLQGAPRPRAASLSRRRDAGAAASATADSGAPASAGAHASAYRRQPTSRQPRRPTAARIALAISLGALAAPLSCAAAGLDDNITSLTGTWSSGSGAVSTGLGFFNPVTFDFAVPPAGGISYSFTDDGFWEQSKYIFANDPTHNRCINATLLWQHGTYEAYTNGSLMLTPYPADGHVLVINTCGRQTVHESYYNQPELIPQWSIYLEANTGFASSSQSAYALQMYQDGGNGALGAAMAPLYLQARPPVMLPTQQLHEPVLNG